LVVRSKLLVVHIELLVVRSELQALDFPLKKTHLTKSPKAFWWFAANYLQFAADFVLVARVNYLQFAANYLQFVYVVRVKYLQFAVKYLQLAVNYELPENPGTTENPGPNPFGS
jgi:hypothetical protein